MSRTQTITKIKEKGDRYAKYELKCYVGDTMIGYGTIVMEKYPQGWNIELMRVHPTRQGFGTQLLLHVLPIYPGPFTVCPTTMEAKAFFAKHKTLLAA